MLRKEYDFSKTAFQDEKKGKDTIIKDEHILIRKK